MGLVTRTPCWAMHNYEHTHTSSTLDRSRFAMAAICTSIAPMMYCMHMHTIVIAIATTIKLTTTMSR